MHQCACTHINTSTHINTNTHTYWRQQRHPTQVLWCSTGFRNGSILKGRQVEISQNYFVVVVFGVIHQVFQLNKKTCMMCNHKQMLAGFKSKFKLWRLVIYFKSSTVQADLLLLWKRKIKALENPSAVLLKQLFSILNMPQYLYL